MTLKTLQPGHWEVKEFLTQNHLSFFNPHYQHELSPTNKKKFIFSGEYADSPENTKKRHQHEFSGFSVESAYFERI